MKKIIGIVFDLDGTLIDSSSHVLESFNFALAPFKITFTNHDIERVRSRTRVELFHDLPITPEEIELAHLRLDQFRHHKENLINLFPGIKELIFSLKELGIPLAIWTGRDTQSAQDIARSLEIAECFRTIQGNCGLKKNKPDSEGLLKVAKTLQICPTELFMIGDHEHDILAAHSAGAHSVKVNWGDNQNCSQQPLKQFDQVTELANFLINYFKGNKLNETNSAKCYSS